MSDRLAYSIASAAEVADISVSILRNKIAKNELTVRYVGSKPVILADELKAWLLALPTEAARK